MRRSGAPSYRKLPSNACAINPSPNRTETNNVTSKSLDPKILSFASPRSTSSILNLFSKNESSKVENANVDSNEAVNNKSNSGKKIFNVVWGKRTTKKHKTWEGDGTLEVGEKTVVLRDMEGNILGRTGMKTSDLEVGMRIGVGSKEIELIEIASDFLTKQPNSEDEKPPPKKQKSLKSTGFNTPLNRTIKRKAGSSVLDYLPLIMPPPSHELQWKNNSQKRPLVTVSVDPCIARALRPHQRDGVVFLYECVMGFRLEDYYGAILADEMGLGKTLQCISLAWMLLKQGPYGMPILKRILIVVPSSLCSNWQNEFMLWLGKERIKTFVVSAKNKPKEYAKISHIPVMIISYEMFVKYFEDLNGITFDLLICDEGHRLKNNSIKATTLINQIKCKRRIILTGTPIQNDLQEFFTLIDLVNPGILGTANEYRNYFEQPIIKSQQLNCSSEEKSLGEARANDLNLKTSNFILRRTQEINNRYLPTKQELVIFCKSSDLQNYIYKAALNYYENRSELSDSVHLQLINSLKKICNHPSLVRASASDQSNKLNEYLTNLLPNWDEMGVEDSGKLKIVEYLLEKVSATRERVVLVSYFTKSLDMLASICDHHAYKYCRLDGSTPVADRNKIVDNFNNPNSDLFVLLLSAKAGGTGLNIVGGSRLVLFDTDWNPATDLQAMSRIWRDGQKREVIIYRLLTAGTIEEKMYQRQISKTNLSGAVVDATSSSIGTQLKLSQDELKDLFSFEEEQCLTHDMLKCDCSGDGEIPAASCIQNLIDKNDQDENRDCQLVLDSSTAQPSQSLRMHQLWQWEHHKHPVRKEILDAINLTDISEEILFIFRNQCSTT